MAEKIQIPLDVADALSNISKLSKALEKVKLPDNLTKNIAKAIADLQTDLRSFGENFGKAVAPDQLKSAIGDSKTIGKEFNALTKALSKISQLSDKAIKGLVDEKTKKNLEAFNIQVVNAQTKINSYNTTIRGLVNSQNKLDKEIKEEEATLKQLQNTVVTSEKEYQKYATEIAKTKQELNQFKKEQKKTDANSETWLQLQANIDETQEKLETLKEVQDKRFTSEKLNSSVKESTQKIDKLKANFQLLGTQIDTQEKNITGALNIITQSIKDTFGIDIQLNSNNPIKSLQDALSQVDTATINNVRDKFKELSPAIREVSKDSKDCAASTEQLAASEKDLNEKMASVNAFKTRMAYFFGITNAINLVKRAIRSAFNSIKELDAIMTETAVVTDFSVSDMWEQLPEYTKRANELGVTIADAYKSATLFYQQGLKTNEVIGVSNQTLKMARIAGLDATEATNKMTAALRGFNMEVNETNAERISDVYSKLAAITASNVREISTAMTKTASLASNAGMQFETTAAFLSQIIETTRESAETAGTALKTVIARFQELKKDPSLIEDVDGEAVDANKIETALKSVGVALRDSAGQFRDLDQVFLDLAERWDTLSTNTQRYIATIAAGSRQQSRFIAMMSDYARTQQLVAAANSAAGASTEQYEKTLESLQTKLNQLSNAVKEFTMSLADNNVIKWVVDRITDIINGINKLTSALPGPLNGFSKLAIAFGAFKTGGIFIDGFLKKFISLRQQTGNFTGNLLPSTTAGIKNVGAAIKGIFTKKQQVSQFAKDFDNLRTKSGQYFKVLQNGNATVNEFTNKYKISSEQMQVYNTILKQARTEEEREQLAKQASIVLEDQEAAASMKVALATNQETAQKKLQELQEKKNNRTGLAGIIQKIRELGARTLNKKMVDKETMAKAKETVGTKAATEAQVTYNGALLTGLGIIGLVIAAVAAFVAIIAVFAYGTWYNSISQRLKRISKSVQQATDDVKEATERLKDLTDQKNSLQELTEEFEDLQKGTEAWNQKLLEINSTVLELIDKYPQLREFMSVDKNGMFTISAEGWKQAIAGQQQGVLNAQAALSGAEVEKANIQQQQARQQLNESVGTWWVTNGKYGDLGIESIDDIGKIVEKYARENNKTIAEIAYNDQDLQAIANQSGFNNRAYTEFLQSLKDNRKALVEYEKTIKDLEETQKRQGELYFSQYLGAQGLSGSDYAGAVQDTFSNFSAGDKFTEYVLGNVRKYAGTSDFKDNDSIKEIAAKYKIQNQLTGDDKEDLIRIIAAQKQVDYDKIVETYKEFDEKELKRIIASTELMSETAEKMGTAVEKLDVIAASGTAGVKRAQEYAAALSGNINDVLVGDRFYEALGDEITNEAATKLAETIANELGLGNAADFFEYSGTLGDQGMVKRLEELRAAAKESMQKLQEFYQKIGVTLNEELNGLTYQTANAFEDRLAEVFYRTSQSQEVFDAIVEMGSTISEEFKQAFWNTIASTDFTDKDAVNQLKQRLEQEGIVIKDFDTYIEKIVKAANTMYKLDYDGLQSRVEKVGKAMQSILEEGSRIISEETFKSIPKQYQDQFVKMIDGTYAYLGSSTIDLAKQMYEGVADAFSDSITQQYAFTTLAEYAQKWNTTNHRVDWASGDGDVAWALTELAGLGGNREGEKLLNDMGYNLQALLSNEEEAREVLSKLQQANVESERLELQNMRRSTGASVGQLNFASGAKSILVAGENVSDKFVEGFKAALIKRGFSDIVLNDNDVSKWIESASEVLSKGVLDEIKSKFDDEDIDSILSMFGIAEKRGDEVDLIRRMLNGDQSAYNTLLNRSQNPEQAMNSGLLGLSGEATTFISNWNNLIKGSKELGYNFDELVNSTNTYKYYMEILNNLTEELNEKLEKGNFVVEDYSEGYLGQFRDTLGALYSNRELVLNSIMQKRSGFSEKANNAIEVDYETGMAYIKTAGLNEDDLTEIAGNFETLSEDVSKLTEINNQIRTLDKNRKEMVKKLIDTQHEFKQQLYDAIVSLKETEIEKLENINSAINDANSKIVQSIQTAVSDQRQQRQNEQTEQEIMDKQERLAYLRMDSAANANEIAQLEKEIADAQLNYSDSLVDQQINKLQDANEKAQEQREEQIKILQEQLDYEKTIGSIWSVIEFGGDKQAALTAARSAAGYSSMADWQKDEFDALFEQNWALRDETFEEGEEIEGISSILDKYKGEQGLKVEVVNYNAKENTAKDIAEALDNNKTLDTSKHSTASEIMAKYGGSGAIPNYVTEHIKGWLGLFDSIMGNITNNNYNEANVQFYMDGITDPELVSDVVLHKLENIMHFRQNAEINPR